MDSYSKKIVVITNGVPKVADDQISCDSEKELYEVFHGIVQKIDPDILSGWYCNGFDLPYIILRAIRLNIDTRKLGRSELQQCYAKLGNKHGNDKTDKWNISVPGRQCFDLLDAFRKYYAPKGGLDAYDLKSVIANKKVMEDNAFTYKDYGGSIEQLFNDKQWDVFLQYCRYDVIALDTIDSKLKLIEFYEQLRKTSGVKIEETLMNSRVIESMIMRAGIKPMPTKSYLYHETESFEGAVVLIPPLGVHSNVGVVDLNALYPNIIVGFNISPDIDGVIPRVIKTVMEEREVLRRLKNEGKADAVMKNKEQVLKYLANSFYGVLGWDKFRLYNRDQAAFITKTGRDLNAYLQTIATYCGYTVLYGDTDSVFIGEFPSVSDGYKFEKICNDRLVEWSKSKGSTVNFGLKFEKLYRKILFKKAVSGKMAKKRYAGHLIFKDGRVVDELDMTGGETKRSDQSEITKGILLNFLQKVLIEDKYEEALHDIKILVKSVKRGEVSIHKLGIPRGIKDPDGVNPHARGVKNLSSQFNINIPDGIKPRLIYTKDKNYPELCIYEDVDEEMIKERFDIDYPMCISKTIEKKMRTYIESIGESWEVIVLGQKRFW
jgi:DNA polymerase I